MMVKLFRSVRGLVKQELNLANRQNGDHFHSAHEAYGVITEEHTEAWDETINVSAALDRLLGAIRRDDPKCLDEAAKDIERHAMLAASEYIQVAAMARKLREGKRAKHDE